MRKYLPILLLLLCAAKASAQVPTLDKNCVATTGTNQTFCTVTGVAVSDAVIVHLYFGTGGGGLTSLQDCAGSSACSSTTDTLTPSISCTVLLGTNVCEYYICASALSGTMSVTANYTGITQVNYVEVSTWKGMLSGGCLDQTGSNTAGASSTSLSINTAGNVGHKGELVIGFIQASSVPSPVAPYTQIQISGNLQSQYATSPTSGVPANTSWTFSSASARGLISTWKGGISADSHSAGQNCGNVSSCAWNHTVGTGPNPMLWVVFSESTGFNNPTVSSVTAGGVGMNLAKNITSGSGLMQVRAYYLTAAGGLPTGTISIVITLSAAVGTTGGFYAGSQSFFGVAQANPFDAATITNTAASGTTYSAAITTATSGAWIIDGFTDNSGAGAATANSPQVTSWTAGAASRNAGSSYQGPVVTPSSNTSSWADGTNTGAWAIIVAALKPDGALAPAGVANNMVPMVI